MVLAAETAAVEKASRYEDDHGHDHQHVGVH
jgi:hypothetical protein